MRTWLFLFLALATPAHASNELFAVTTTYEVVGSTARIGLGGGYPTVTNEYQVHSDAVVRSYGRYVFVVNRLFADNVLVLDAGDGYRVLRQFSVATTGLNPRDVEMVGPARAYVTLYEDNTILVCNPLTGAKLGDIDLSAFADGDGTVEMDQMVRVEDRVFVTLQNVDRRVSPWGITGKSTIIVIDTDTDTVVDADLDLPGVQGIALQGQNPYWRLHFDPRRQRLFTVGAGSFQQRDGGLERIDPFRLRSEGFVVTETALGGELLDFALASDTIGWALINDASFNTCLVRFDPSTGTKIDDVRCTSGFLLTDLELSRDGRLFVGDRTASNPGVRVYDALTGQALAGPISTGLPPFDFTLIEGVPTSTPPTQLTARLSAFPNPFNPRVTIEAEGATTGTIEVVDPRGRVVRRLELRDGRVEWDGFDTTGALVASGTYRARLIGAPHAGAVALTLVR